MNAPFSSLSYINRQWNDVVFENRNKDYGAYYIRTHYNENVGIAFVVTSFFLLSVFGSVFLYLAISEINITIPAKPPVEVLPKVPPTVIVEPPTGGGIRPPQTHKSNHAFAMSNDTTKDENTDTTLISPAVISTGFASSLFPSTGSFGGTSGSTSSQGVSAPVTIDTTVHKFAEFMPEFPGGETALDNYILKHINIPRQWSNEGSNGKIYFSFIVGTDGNVRDVRIISDKVGFGCAESNTALFLKMPNWKPGRQNGYPVNVMMQLPLIFKKE